MGNLNATLTFGVVDNATKPARSIAQALQESEKRLKAVTKAMSNTGAPDKFVASLAKLKLSAKDIESVSAAWKTYSASAKLAAHASDWTKEQIAGVKRWGAQTLAELRAVERERIKFENAMRRGGGSGGHGDRSGRQIAAGIVGGYIAHSTAHFARHSLETYREFDKERRYAKAVMGISDGDQTALIEQAIHGGATSKFNDIQWLEAQRELAARGLNRNQVLGITPIAARLGQAMDKSLPEASRLLEGGMFGFGKDVSTLEKARASAARTADLQVKASKISGMNAEDVQQAYKYAAAPARMAGLSEEQMLAFAALGKKANMGGDEMGVAIRALGAALLKPTAGARTAMLANGVDYSRYQRLGPQAMRVEPFAQDIATRYGVALNEKTKAGLQRIFDDRALVQDAGKFMPAVLKLLGKALGGDDAKSKAKIAGAARGYRDAAMAGIDVQSLLKDLLPILQRNPSLANLLFGSKQGGRLGMVMQNAEAYLHKLDELEHHSDGYADRISQERMAGFDGAVSRFEGAIKNLESALPRAFDDNGKGGLLTGATNKIGELVQSLAEANPHMQRLGVETGAVAAIFAGWKGAEALLGGFGLKGSAVALTGAAEALTAAAGKQALANGIPGAGAHGKPGSKTFMSRMGKVVAGTAIVGSVIEAASEVGGYLKDKKRENPHWTDTPGWIKKFQPPKPYQRERSDLPGVDDYDPPATPGEPPHRGLTGLRAAAKEARSALDALATPVTPIVDGRSLDETLAKARALVAALSSLNGLAKGVSAAVAGINPPSLGSLQRGSFNGPAVKGE